MPNTIIFGLNLWQDSFDLNSCDLHVSIFQTSEWKKKGNPTKRLPFYFKINANYRVVGVVKSKPKSSKASIIKFL